jgi:hypothetical protein
MIIGAQGVKSDSEIKRKVVSPPGRRWAANLRVRRRQRLWRDKNEREADGRSRSRQEMPTEHTEDTEIRTAEDRGLRIFIAEARKSGSAEEDKTGGEK